MKELLNKKFILWGTGALGKRLYNEVLLRKINLPINCFIDNDITKKDSQLLDLTVYYSADIKKIKTNEHVIVICSSFIQEISEQLDSLGYKKSVDYIYYYELYEYIEFLIASEHIQFFDDIKLIVGANQTSQKGWISTNQSYLDLLKKEDWNQLFGEKSIHSIVAEHVWEHLTYEQGLIAARNCYAQLKNGGRLRIAIPDGNNPNPYYIQWIKPNGYGDAADDHKVMYTHGILEKMLKEAGFSQIEKIEYFDENGKFHSVKWNIEDGFIKRSKDNDPRNWRGDIVYTSLIIDAIK